MYFAKFYNNKPNFLSFFFLHSFSPLSTLIPPQYIYLSVFLFLLFFSCLSPYFYFSHFSFLLKSLFLMTSSRVSIFIKITFGSNTLAQCSSNTLMHTCKHAYTRAHAHTHLKIALHSMGKCILFLSLSPVFYQSCLEL